MSEYTYSAANILSRVKGPLGFPFAGVGLPRSWCTNVFSLTNCVCVCVSWAFISLSHSHPQLLGYSSSVSKYSR